MDAHTFDHNVNYQLQNERISDNGQPEAMNEAQAYQERLNS